MMLIMQRKRGKKVKAPKKSLEEILAKATQLKEKNEVKVLIADKCLSRNSQ